MVDINLQYFLKSDQTVQNLVPAMQLKFVPLPNCLQTAYH